MEKETAVEGVLRIKLGRRREIAERLHGRHDAANMVRGLLVAAMFGGDECRVAVKFGVAVANFNLRAE